METIQLSIRGRDHDAAVAMPESGDGPFPGVVVVHDIYGFTRDLKRHCRRFADAGYAAIGPDLYAGGAPGCVVKVFQSIATNDGLAYEVIDAARSHLASRADVDADSMAVVGFCMGGGFALIAAADQSFAVAAPFYGVVPKKAERLKGICPTIAQFGGKDTPFLPHAKRLSRHLEELNVDHELLIYDEAGHSFMNQLEGPFATLGRYTPLKAAYAPTTEQKAWQALLTFLGDRLPP